MYKTSVRSIPPPRNDDLIRILSPNTESCETCERMILHLLCFSHFLSHFRSFNLSLLVKMPNEQRQKEKREQYSTHEAINTSRLS